MLFLTTNGAIFQEPDAQASQGNIIVCHFISYLNLLLPNSNSEFFVWADAGKPCTQTFWWTLTIHYPVIKLSELKPFVIRYPFSFFPLIDFKFLNSEWFCLFLDMYRMASNRFVSRSSRLLYFLTVSDTYCRSIIDFIDQKDDGFFALFFATDPRSGFEFGFASCLLDFGRLVAALQALSFSLIIYVFSRGHPSVPILSRGQGVAFLLICFVVPKHFLS